MDPGDQTLTLDDFNTWKIDSLRDFLTKRGLSKDGSKKELSALCFAASCMKFPIIPSTSHILKQNELDYEKLLHVDDEVIPDPLSVHSGWVEEKFGLPQWPPVYITDIASFLASKKSSTVLQSMLNKYKIGKAYEYYQSGHLQQIYYHHISNSCLNCILYAKCTPSQKLKEDSHTVWVCCAKESGAVKSAYCTCTAGLGSTCNHVAGLLFRVEAANKMGYTSCTSIPCSWTEPSKKHKTVIPIKLKDMTIRKSRHGETDKRPLTAKGKASFNPVQGAATNIDKNEMLSTFATALREALPNSCLNRGTVYRDEHISAEESPKIIIQDFTMSALLNQESDATNFIKTLPKYTSEESQAVALATVGQSSNPLWHLMKKDRLTSSNFYSVHTKIMSMQSKPDTDMKPLLCNILGYKKINPNIRSIKHGRELEPEAKLSYRKNVQSAHSNFTVTECGFFVDTQYPYLGASPDLLVSCDCCGDGVVEIKCPLVSKCVKCPSLCTCNLPIYLRNSHGCLRLKKNHSHYCQIQGQLAITGRKYCDFYVYTCNGYHIERIPVDKSYYLQTLDSLIFFFEKFVVPELFSRTLKSLKEKTVSLPANSEPEAMDIATTYFCPVCRHVVKEEDQVQTYRDQSIGCDVCGLWFHFRCVQMNKTISSKLDQWTCPKCTVQNED